MKIETQTREDHQVRLVVEIEPESMEKFKRQAARKIAHEAKIPGFRPGKAPYDVVRRMYGDQTITNQAIDLMVDEIYPEVITQSGIKPGGPGSLDQIVNLNPPTFAFLVPLAPKVEIGDFHSIRQEFTPPEITDSEVEDYIQRLRTNYATVEPAERPAGEKDLVYLTVTQTITNPSEGQNPEISKDSPMQFIIPTEEEEKDEKYPFPGFGRQLIGLSANDEKTLQYTHPDDDSEEALRGKTIDFQVKIQSVKAMKLPDLTDEFAQMLGEYQSVEALRTSLKERMQHNASDEYEQNYFTQLIDKVRVMSTVAYPPQSLNDEISEVTKLLERDLARQNMEMDTYLKMRSLDKDALVEQEIKPAAIRRLERSLVMDEIGRAEKIQLDPQALQGMVTQTLSEMQSSGELKKMQKNATAEQLVDVVTYDAASRMMNRKVLERLKAIATGQAEELPAPEVEAEVSEAVPTELVAPEPATEAGESSATSDPTVESEESTPSSSSSESES